MRLWQDEKAVAVCHPNGTALIAAAEAEAEEANQVFSHEEVCQATKWSLCYHKIGELQVELLEHLHTFQYCSYTL